MSDKSDEDNFFRESLQEGLWKQVTLKNINFDIIVEKNDDFECVIIKLSKPNKNNYKSINFDFYENGFIDLESNNAILLLEQKGKWLGIISATIYDKTTEYLLVDLEKTIDIDNEIISYKYLGSTRGGWINNFPITDFLVDFEKEIVVYNNGKTKSFEDCLDLVVPNIPAE
jgi:hypothetical protein